MSDPEHPILEPDDNEPGEPKPTRPVVRGSYTRSRRVRAAGRLEVGDSIGQAFSIWFGNLIPFSGLALLVYAPFLIVVWMFYSRSPMADPDAVRTFQLVVNLADKLFFSMLLAGAVTYGVVMQLRGQRAAMGRSLTMGLSRLIHVLLVSIVMALVYAMVLAAGLLPAVVSPVLGIVTILVAGVFVILFFCRFFVAIPAVVVEQIGVGEALGRSSYLTKGFRGTIFGVWFLFAILVGLMMLPVVFAVGMMLTGIAPWVEQVVVAVIGVLLSPLSAILPCVVYHALRTTKEGVNTEDLAAVFE
jgi:hypothetical protein